MTEELPLPELPVGAPARRRSCLVPFILVSLAMIGIAAGAWFWTNRPIKPVELSQSELQAVEAKLEVFEEPPEDPTYEKGSREIVLTERELNGLLHHNTGMGDQLKLELATDAIHARLENDLDPDLPIVGGRRLRARARFFVKMENERPMLVLDDLTVWGVAMPNDWLGGMKGRDLLAEIFGSATSPGDMPMAGVESIKIEPRRLIIRLAE